MKFFKKKKEDYLLNGETTWYSKQLQNVPRIVTNKSLSSDAKCGIYTGVGLFLLFAIVGGIGAAIFYTSDREAEEPDNRTQIGANIMSWGITLSAMAFVCLLVCLAHLLYSKRKNEAKQKLPQIIKQHEELDQSLKL